MGLFCFAVMLWPIAANRHYDLLSTWSLATLSVVLGCLIRGFYIGIEYPDFYTLNIPYSLNKPMTDFYWPATMLVSCLLCCAIGYIYGPVKTRRKQHSRRILDTKRLYFFAFTSLFMAIACTVLYVNLTGGLDWQNISGKRTLIDSINLDNSHRTYGYLRTVSYTHLTLPTIYPV